MQWKHVQHMDRTIPSIIKTGLKKTCGPHTKISIPTNCTSLNLIYGCSFVRIQIPPDLISTEIILGKIISFFPKTYTTWQVGSWVVHKPITQYQKQILTTKTALINWLEEISTTELH